MANVDVIMPQMGESITEGTLVKWLKKAGDKVNRDEPLFEISTEKVDVEIPSPISGILFEVKIAEGQTVPINTVVAVMSDDGAAPAQPAATQPAATQPAAAATQPAATQPAATQPAATQPAATQPAATQPAATQPDGRPVRSSPLVRKIAREHGVDVGQIPGTGISGRVTKNDILSYMDRGAQAAVAASAPAVVVSTPATPTAPAAIGSATPLSGRVEPMSTMRKKIAEHMLHSKRTSPHVATVFEMDMTTVVALRNKHKDEFEERHATKLTYTSLIARCVVRSLQEFPLLNASIDGDDIVYHEHVNLGIAVALPDGLIVPVVKSAEERNVLGLQRAINDLAERARTRKLKPDDVQAGTFTITNPGIYGGMFGIPVINQPQVAILGLGGVEKRPVVINDAIAIRPMAYFSMSFDHRLIDGALADQFMAFLKTALAQMNDIG